MKKKNKTLYQSQTDIGKAFNLTPIEVGKILMANGLKDKETKFPTQKAYKKNFAIPQKTQDGKNWYLWNAKKIVPLIKKTESKRLTWTSSIPKPIRGETATVTFYDEEYDTKYARDGIKPGELIMMSGRPDPAPRTWPDFLERMGGAKITNPCGEIDLPANPTIHISSIRPRGFENIIVDSATQKARQEILAEEDAKVFAALDAACQPLKPLKDGIAEFCSVTWDTKFLKLPPERKMTEKIGSEIPIEIRDEFKESLNKIHYSDKKDFLNDVYGLHGNSDASATKIEKIESSFAEYEKHMMEQLNQLRVSMDKLSKLKKKNSSAADSLSMFLRSIFRELKLVHDVGENVTDRYKKLDANYRFYPREKEELKAALSEAGIVITHDNVSDPGISLGKDTPTLPVASIPKDTSVSNSDGIAYTLTPNTVYLGNPSIAIGNDSVAVGNGSISIDTNHAATNEDYRLMWNNTDAKWETMQISACPTTQVKSEQERITELAHQYWEERGRPLGSPEVDWQRAEDTIRAEKSLDATSIKEEMITRALNATEGRNLLAKSMAEPIRRNLDYHGIARRTLVVDQLPAECADVVLKYSGVDVSPSQPSATNPCVEVKKKDTKKSTPKTWMGQELDEFGFTEGGIPIEELQAEYNKIKTSNLSWLFALAAGGAGMAHHAKTKMADVKVEKKLRHAEK